MTIEQKRFFENLGFSERVFSYPSGGETAYAGKDGAYYRVDHFADVYVIEAASNEKAAMLNQFEDADTFDDSLPEDEIIRQIREALSDYLGR